MVWRPKTRQIFKFFDGVKNRGLDPLEADMRLELVDLDWKERFTSIELGDKSAATDIVDAARKIFNVQEYTLADDGTESGLTSVEVLDLLGEFIKYREEIKSFTDATATSPQSTVSVAPSTTENTAG